MTSPDPEIEAMANVASALEPLSDEAIARVLRWASERHGVGPQVGAPSHNALSKEEGGTAPADIGQLFANANAHTNEDRAVLAAYWFQQYQEARSFSGQQVNSELKQMGHGVANITHTLTRLIRERPALVQQLSKSGRSKQARKQYRLTTAGLEAARALLAGGGTPEA